MPYPVEAFCPHGGGTDNRAISTTVICKGCHDSGTSIIQGVSAPAVAGDDATWGFYISGHGRHNAVSCEDCHDTAAAHFDGEARTFSFDSAQYGPTQSGVDYAAAYRLNYVGGEVPLMIPANYNITFSYDASVMSDTPFRLCFECHDSTVTFDDTPGDGIASNFKASLPNTTAPHGRSGHLRLPWRPQNAGFSARDDQVAL